MLAKISYSFIPFFQLFTFYYWNLFVIHLFSYYKSRGCRFLFLNRNNEQKINTFPRLVYRKLMPKAERLIVRKTNSRLRSESSRATVKFWVQSFSRGHYPPIHRQGAYLFYNPPNNSSRRTHVDRCCIFCRFLRVSLCGFVNQLLNFSVTSFCKEYSCVFHDRLKV